MNVPPHHPNLREDDGKPGTYCFMNNERVCAADCTSFVSPMEKPEGVDYVGKEWAQCHLLINAHRVGKHITIIAATADQLMKKLGGYFADQRRMNQVDPKEPAMIPCDITDIAQEFDLSKKEQRTYALLLLRNGHRIRVPVTEEDASIIIKLSMTSGEGDYKDPPSTNSSFTEREMEDGSDALVFGANAEDQEEEDFEEEREPIKVGAIPRPVEGVRPRLVGVDEKGNPIMEYKNGVDPSSVIGGPSANADEDGVQQL